MLAFLRAAATVFPSPFVQSRTPTRYEIQSEALSEGWVPQLRELLASLVLHCEHIADYGGDVRPYMSLLGRTPARTRHRGTFHTSHIL